MIQTIIVQILKANLLVSFSQASKNENLNKAMREKMDALNANTT